MATFKAINDGSAIIAQADGLTRVEQRMVVRGALRNIMKPTFATAKELAPKDKGALAASLKLRAIARTRRGVGVLIATTGELTKAQSRKNTAFGGEHFYGSFVHFGHRFVSGKRPTNEMMGWKYRKHRTVNLRLKVAEAEVARQRGRFPGIPFMKEAGEMHRPRMEREFEAEFKKEVLEVLAKR